MGWLIKAMAACDSCDKTRPVVDDRERSSQLLRAGGWRHMQGHTIGGEPFETILCPSCAKHEKSRPRKQGVIEQEALPLDFESGRKVIGAQGVSSR